jgi:nucleoside-diphosphate-sugar epimerase
MIPVFTFQMLAGELLTVFGDGEQTHDFVNVDDIAAAEAALGFVPSAAIERVAEYAGWTRDEPQRA